MKNPFAGTPAMFASYRSKLQAAFLLLGLASIALTGWQASSGASEALREATYDHLTAIRETRAQELERYFTDVRNHVAALSTDTSTIEALNSLHNAWQRLPMAGPGSAGDRAVRSYYEQLPFLDGTEQSWLPQDPRTTALQYFYLAANPHPPGAKDLLVDAEYAGAYGDIHARYHPTLHRYLTSFGFYDILLISSEGRVLYSVMKEIDLGASLMEEPHRSTALAKVYRDAMALDPGLEAVTEDYTPYVASGNAPAAFVAAPILQAGMPVGVLAIQISIDEINNLMHGGRRWREEGFGATGQSYLIGPDNTLRSDLRIGLENPEEYFAQLESAGVSPETISTIQNNETAVLAYPVNLDVVERIQEGERGTEIGVGIRGRPVLRSHAPLTVADLNWAIIAEIETDEALAPITALRSRILVMGLGVSFVFLFAAAWLAVSVTRPVLRLAATAREIGSGNLEVEIPVEGTDEIAQLAANFNRMARDLQTTTVSKRELEILAGRLITAQEDERGRLARELHDDLTQRLAAVAIEAGSLERIPEDSPNRALQIQGGLERIKQHMARLATDVHGLSRRLHPSLLNDLGLDVAIEAECRALLERGGPPVAARIEGSFEGLTKDARLAIFRIVQESLRNIQRHAAAEQVALHLTEFPDRVELTIEDDGRGFDRSSPEWKAGLGLASMEERVRLLGGTLAVTSSPGNGVRIKVAVPKQAGEMPEHQEIEA